MILAGLSLLFGFAHHPKHQWTPWNKATVSEYGTTDGFMGATTASGQKVTPYSLGVANLTLPFGTKVQFCLNRRCVTAYVDDRGPYVAGRLFDLQPAVAEAIGFPGLGVVSYRIRTR